MKLRIKLAMLTALVIVTACTGSVCAYVHLDGDAASITGEGTLPLTPGPTLDNFDSGEAVNVWGCITNTYSSEGATPPANAICSASFSDSIRCGSSGYSLKLDYNVSKSSATFAGYTSPLGGGSLSSYTTVSFFVRGVLGGEFFKVELKNNGSNADTNHAAVYITDYLDGGVTASWQQVTIPLHNFANINIGEWGSGKELVITFENTQSGWQGATTSGTVYIDNITFGNSEVTAVRINSFATKFGRCALGGNMGNMPNEFPTVSWAKFTFPTDQYLSAPSGLLSEYNVNGGDWWSGHWIVFGGGNSGGTAIPHNFNAFNYLRLAVKAKSSSENPKKVKLELAYDGGTAIYWIDGISTDWNTYTFALPSPGKSSLKQLNIVYSAGDIYNAGGRWVGLGGIYIDDIRLEKT